MKRVNITISFLLFIYCHLNMLATSLPYTIEKKISGIAKGIHEEIMKNIGNQARVDVLISDLIVENVSWRNITSIKEAFRLYCIEFLKKQSNTVLHYKDEYIHERWLEFYKQVMRDARKMGDIEEVNRTYDKYFEEGNYDYLVITAIYEDQNKLHFISILIDKARPIKSFYEYFSLSRLEINKWDAYAEGAIDSKKFDNMLAYVNKAGQRGLDRSSDIGLLYALESGIKDDAFRLRGNYAFRPDEIVDIGRPDVQMHLRESQIELDALVIPHKSHILNLLVSGSVIYWWNYWDYYKDNGSIIKSLSSKPIPYFHKRTETYIFGGGVSFGNLRNGISFVATKAIGYAKDITLYQGFPKSLNIDRNMYNQDGLSYQFSANYYDGKFEINLDVTKIDLRADYNANYFGEEFSTKHNRLSCLAKFSYYGGRWKIGLWGSYFNINNDTLDSLIFYLNERVNGYGFGASVGYVFGRED